MADFCSRAALSMLSIMLLGVSLLFMFFIVLSGLSDVAPFNATHFLRADTRGISGARDITQWNFFYICGHGNINCSPAQAAPALGNAWSPNPIGAPRHLIGTHGGNTTSGPIFFPIRIGWVFFIIGMFFTVTALIGSFMAFFGHLGAKLSGFSSMVALLWHLLAMILFTVGFGKARYRFREVNREANFGPQAFGFGWAAVALILLSTIFFYLGGRREKRVVGSDIGKQHAMGGGNSRNMFSRRQPVTSAY